MWMLGPLSIGAASSAAMMMWSPFYWGLYLSMSPARAETGRRVAGVERDPAPAAQHAAADDRDALRVAA